MKLSEVIKALESMKSFNEGVEILKVTLCVANPQGGGVIEATVLDLIDKKAEKAIPTASSLDPETEKRYRQALKEIIEYTQKTPMSSSESKYLIGLTARQALEGKPEEPCTCPPNGFCPTCRGKKGGTAYCAKRG